MNLGHHLRNAQEADAPPGHPIVVDLEKMEFRTAKFDSRLAMMQSEEIYQLPEILFYNPPVQGDGEVIAPADGYVLKVGKTLVLGHRLPSGAVLQSIFQGVEDVKTRAGALVGRGTVLAERGTFSGVSRSLVIGAAPEALDGVELPPVTEKPSPLREMLEPK